MLSVQAPGCAGMERLGAPGGATPHLRHDPHHTDRDDLAREVGRLLERQARARSAAAAELLALPPRLELPDGERVPNTHIQLRVAYQQAELTRCCVQAPPNKSVSDVPEWAAGGAPAGARRSAPGKKDGFVQKAVRYLVRMGAPRQPALLQQLGAAELAAQRLQRDLATLRRPVPPPPPGAPCVMVPRRPPHV